MVPVEWPILVRVAIRTSLDTQARRSALLARRRAEQEGSGEQFQELTARLAALEEGQRRLLEQQEFMEALKDKDKEELTTISSGD